MKGTFIALILGFVMLLGVSGSSDPPAVVQTDQMEIVMAYPAQEAVQVEYATVVGTLISVLSYAEVAPTIAVSKRIDERICHQSGEDSYDLSTLKESAVKKSCLVLRC